VSSAKEVSELDKVYIFGFPLGKRLGAEITINESQVSSLRRKRKGGELDRIQVRGGMEPGNSGGPVVDASGHVIGVAVSGIPGALINFAIPGDRVHVILNGRIVEMAMTQSYYSAGQIAVPVRLAMIDPRNRIKEVGIELWTGNPPRAGAGQRPPSKDKAPSPLEGDSARQRVALSYISPEGQGEMVLPELPAGKTYWVQPYWVQGDGVAHWASGSPYRLNTIPVERKPAMLAVMHRNGTQAMTLTITNTFSVGSDADSEVASMLTKAGLSERCQVKGPAAGAAYHVTYKSFAQRVVVQKRERPNPLFARLKPHLGHLVALLDVDPAGNLRSNKLWLNPPAGTAVPEAQFARLVLSRDRSGRALTAEPLIDLHEPVRAGLDALAVPLPGKAVNALETWKATRVMPIERPDGKVQKLPMELTYTYLGQRKRNGRDEAVISVAGAVSAETMGARAGGTAIVDLATGRIILAEMRVTIDLQALALDLGGRIEKVKLVDALVVRLERNP
jgi:hypothetical protein